jgi:hypothetical protein
MTPGLSRSLKNSSLLGDCLIHNAKKLHHTSKEASDDLTTMRLPITLSVLGNSDRVLLSWTSKGARTSDL